MTRKLKKYLITGVTGSGGSYLAEHIWEKNLNIKLFGFYRSRGYLKLLKKIIPKLDKKLLRLQDIDLQIADCKKFKKDTGWKPKISFNDSVKKLLNHCRQHP